MGEKRIFRAVEIQAKCPSFVTSFPKVNSLYVKIRKHLHDRQWKLAADAIDRQIQDMQNKIEFLQNYQQFLKNLKEG